MGTYLICSLNCSNSISEVLNLLDTEMFSASNSEKKKIKTISIV